MPMPRPIDSTLHGATDYSVGTLLMTAFPKLAGIEGTQSAKQIRAAGAIHASYSTMIDYPRGVVKVIPYKAHLAIDALGAFALAATPFVTGQWKKGRSQWLPHVGLCLFELSALLLGHPTQKGRLPGGWDAVRRANMEDPGPKIHSGPRAVQPAAA